MTIWPSNQVRRVSVLSNTSHVVCSKSPRLKHHTCPPTKSCPSNHKTNRRQRRRKKKPYATLPTVGSCAAASTVWVCSSWMLATGEVPVQAAKDSAFLEIATKGVDNPERLFPHSNSRYVCVSGIWVFPWSGVGFGWWELWRAAVMTLFIASLGWWET